MRHPLSLFRHCPRCGSPRFAPADARSKHCADCGFTYYHNASAATVAVIFSADGSLLATRRALDPARGTLDLPGGFVDPGESLEEGCLREVKEETGADAEVEGYLFSLPNTYRYSGFDVHTADSFFRCRLKPGQTPAAADDAAELLWLRPEDIRPADFGLCSVRRGVERLLQLMEKGTQKLARTGETSYLSAANANTASGLNLTNIMTTVTFQGTPVTLSGTLPAVGTAAPKFGGVKGDLSVVHLPDLLGHRVVLNIFPSLDTPVCAASVRRFNREAAALDNTVVLCVSKDLPFAQSRFCTTEGLDRVVPVSTFRCKCFDEHYGLLITDGPLKGLLARAVVIVDEEGKIIYEELVPEITHEPDYAAALAALGR